MWDPIKKFEEIQQVNKSVFGKLEELFGNGKNVVDKYKKGIKTGEECKEFGTQPNNQFWSEVGSTKAKIGRNGFVNDISDFQLSKREFRCYDVKNDPRRIGWLFNGNYEANKIWGTTGKVYFDGTWKGGDFKGIMTPNSKFEGGNFKGQWLKDVGQKQEKKIDPKKIFKPGFKTISFKRVPGIEIEDLLLEILDEKEFEVYNKITKDIQSGAFLIYLKRIKRLVDSGKLDGYGNMPSLNYLFAEPGTNAKKLEQEELDLIKYLLYVKKLISTFVKKDGSPNIYYQKVFIDRLKNIIGLKKLTTAQQKTTPTKQVSKKPVKKVKMAENKLFVKDELLKIINS